MDVTLSHGGKVALVLAHGREKGAPTRLRLWDVALKKPIRHFEGFPAFRYAYHLLFSADDRLAMSSLYADKKEPTSVILWDVNTGKIVRSFAMERYSGALVGIFPDGRRAFAAHPTPQGQAPRLGIWEVSTGKEVAQLEAPRGATDVFATDNAHLLFSGPQTLTYVDCARGEPVWRDPPEKIDDSLWSSAVSPNGKLAFTGCGSIGIAPRDSNGVASGGDGMKLTLWDLEKGEVLRNLSDPKLTK